MPIPTNLLLFEFRYDEITRQSSPGQEFFSCLELRFVCLPFRPKRVFVIYELLKCSTLRHNRHGKLLSDIMTVPKRNGILIDKDNRQSSRQSVEKMPAPFHILRHIFGLTFTAGSTIRNQRCRIVSFGIQWVKCLRPGENSGKNSWRMKPRTRAIWEMDIFVSRRR